MSYESSGTIRLINDTQVISDTFSKREFVIDTPGEFSQALKFEFVQDKCGILDGYQPGQQVTVHFNIRGSENQGRYFVNLNSWRIALAGEQSNQDEHPPTY